MVVEEGQDDNAVCANPVYRTMLVHWPQFTGYFLRQKRDSVTVAQRRVHCAQKDANPLTWGPASTTLMAILLYIVSLRRG